MRPTHQQQIEKIAVLEALAESVQQAESGTVQDARKAVAQLLSEQINGKSGHRQEKLPWAPKG